MLFTQSTEAGIQLENALILSPEDFAKVSIPANAARVSNWAKEMNVSVNFNQQPNSDFNCFIGIMTDERVSEEQLNKEKKFLKTTGNALMQFIENLPAKEEDASRESIVRAVIDDITKKYAETIEKVVGEEVFVHVAIIRKSSVE
jgi:hypothetical protein